jgi:hypothetical protein
LLCSGKARHPGGGARFHKNFDWGDREIEIRECYREKRYWGIAEG